MLVAALDTARRRSPANAGEELAIIVGHNLEDLATLAPPVATGFLELAGYQAVDLSADGLGKRHYLHALGDRDQVR
jgi:hypothetical protein